MPKSYTPSEIKHVLIAIAEYWEAQKPAYEGDEAAKRIAEHFRRAAENIEQYFVLYESGRLKPEEAAKDG